MRKRHLERRRWLFLNLTQTEGAAVVISVTTFLDRLDRMPGETSLGDAGKKARELLSQRGLGDHTVRIAKGLLEKLGTAEAVQPGPTDPEAQQKAEQTMWNWHLEWGEIARVAVTDRRLLRELGFLNAKRPVAQEEAEVGEESGGSEA